MESNENAPGKRLAGKVAWVTGSSRGIGRVVADHLAALGAKVAIHGTAPHSTRAFNEADSLQAVADAIAEGHNAEVLAVHGDLTSATKHNMLRETDGYFLELAREIAREHPYIEFESFIVDDFACRIVREPARFDVVVMPNQYGDILSDAAGGLLGSLGLAPSGCYGDDYAYFEPAHGTAPDIAGRNIINPTATLLSAAMMLEHLGLAPAARRLEDAVARVYAAGEALTPDQGGSATTTEFCAAVARVLA